jgi:asparagine synthase (glutamine-hydrolysing)
VEFGRYGDETPYVREIVAMHPRLEPHFISTSLRSWDDGLRDFFARGEEIPSLPRWLTVWEQTFQAAKAKRLSVVLNGGGGNLGLSWEGRGAFRYWATSGHWRTLLRELWAIAPGLKPFSRAFLSRVAAPLGPDWLWRLYTRVKYGPSQGAWARYTLLNPDAARELRLESRAEELDVQLRRLGDYRAARIEYLTGDNAESAELCRMARVTHGVDYRSPLLDRRLLEWCLRVPDEQCWRNGQPRWLMRRIMTRQLPNSVVNNRVRGSPGADWHYQMTRQLPFIREQVEVLSADPDAAALIDFPRIRKILDEWPAQTPVDTADPLSYLLPAALPHALAVGQFIRWTKGANL